MKIYGSFNRKNIIVVIIILIFSMALFACSDDNKATDENKNSSFKIEEHTEVKDEQCLSLNIKIPVISGIECANEINKLIEKEKNEAVSEVEDVATSMLEAKANGEDWGSGMCAYLKSEWDIIQTDDVVSIWIRWDNYSGGAHGYYWLQTITFDSATSEIYTFKDLFSTEEGLESVTSLINKEAKKMQEALSVDAIQTVKNYSGNFNYFINGNKIIVYFNPYDIAPYALGIISIDLTAEDLEEYLKNNIFNQLQGKEPTKIVNLEFGEDYQIPFAEENEDADVADNDNVNVMLTGNFVATVRHLIPDYCLDNTTKTVAVVTFFQDGPFAIYVGDELASELEEGVSYYFEIEDMEIGEITKEQFEGGPYMVVESLLKNNHTKFKTVRPSKEDECGLDSVHLKYIEKGQGNE